MIKTKLSMDKMINIGRVILAGAGPGDPELVTIKTAKYLQKADVVLVDRLVSQCILDQHCSADTEIIHVGKQCSLGNSTPQATINDLLVYYAQKGNLVVRLKGGDVSIFSNILDELQTLVENNIPYEIVPGVTAALGASAYAGIPLTARGFSTSVRFLTFCKSNILTNEYWKELSNTADTLVFYMSSITLDRVVKNLTERKIDSDKLIAVIEQATTPNQKVHISDIYEFDKKYGKYKFASPSIVIIGKVVQLHEQFKWLENSDDQNNYFKPVDESIGKIKMTA